MILLTSGFNNHFNNNSGNQGNNVLYQGTDEEKIAKIEALYIQLLEAERSKVLLLEKMLEMEKQNQHASA